MGDSGFRWASMAVWFSGSTVRNTNKLTNGMANPPKKHRKIKLWVKAANIGDLWRRMKRSKTQYNIGADQQGDNKII